MAVTGIAERAPRRTTSPIDYLYRPEVRQVLFQIILIVALAALFWMIISNTADNLKRQNIASGFGFWNTTAGFDISQTLIQYTNTSTYGRVFWVGLTNTLLVAGIGVFFATIVGFTMGIARLSSNWLVARLATVYVETIRNVPLLLQLFVWYFAVLKTLPPPRQSLELPLGAHLNLRGLYLPEPIPQTGFDFVLGALAFGIVAAIARRHLGPPPADAHGRPVPHRPRRARADRAAADRRVLPRRRARSNSPIRSCAASTSRAASSSCPS